MFRLPPLCRSRMPSDMTVRSDLLFFYIRSLSSLLIAYERIRPECLQVKKFVRHNDWPVSHEIRSDLWKVLCHYKDYEFNKRLYVQQLDDLLKSGGTPLDYDSGWS